MTPDPILKICGITRSEDAHVAVAYGATALGFVFWPGSPRRVGVEQAGGIVRALPTGVDTVGVFVNESLEAIMRIVEETGVHTVQLHGDEPSSFGERIPRPIWRSTTIAKVEATARAWPKATLLLDAADLVRRGGTGVRVDWDEAAGLTSGRRIVLAGGLTPANVADAVRLVRPSGVDVSSGVESSPGVKDGVKVAAFLFEARRAFERIRALREAESDMRVR
jgi:phosphoribosylanthranilate isomerase